ncbi:MAG: hypothetical protein ACLR2E_17135 [Lachnospiraceae bacterium]
MTEAELRKIPHLEITEFSCFDMDPVSGTFGGEIRLGYEIRRKDGTGCDQRLPFPEIMEKVLKNMKFSKRDQTESTISSYPARYRWRM